MCGVVEYRSYDQTKEHRCCGRPDVYLFDTYDMCYEYIKRRADLLVKDGMRRGWIVKKEVVDKKHNGHIRIASTFMDGSTIYTDIVIAASMQSLQVESLLSL